MSFFAAGSQKRGQPAAERAIAVAAMKHGADRFLTRIELPELLLINRT